MSDSAAPQFRVLTRARARAEGVPLSDLLGRHYEKLFYDAYVPSDVKITPALRAKAALRLLPMGTRISHHTAVQLWGGVSPGSDVVHVTMTERQRRCRRAGIAAHLGDAQASTSVHHGLPVSAPTQAFLELASAGASLVDLVVAGDSLVKSTRIRPVAFVEAAESWTGNRVRIARRAARLIRSGVDSPMETRLRPLLVLAGLPEPDVNLILRDARGEWQRRFDLCYPDLMLIIEYDGRQHAESDLQWIGDIERREELDRLGWRIIIITADGIYKHPDRTLRKIQTALCDRGAKGVPRRFRPDVWRHFPGQS